MELRKSSYTSSWLKTMGCQLWLFWRMLLPCRASTHQVLTRVVIQSHTILKPWDVGLDLLGWFYMWQTSPIVNIQDFEYVENNLAHRSIRYPCAILDVMMLFDIYSVDDICHLISDMINLKNSGIFPMRTTYIGTEDLNISGASDMIMSRYGHAFHTTAPLC